MESSTRQTKRLARTVSFGEALRFWVKLDALRVVAAGGLIGLVRALLFLIR